MTANQKGARECFAELLGSFALVFAGTGAIVVNEVHSGAIGHVGIALTFGLVVMALIYALGDISGAHFNPAVTFGFWAHGRFAGRTVLPYMAAQCAGAIAASLVLRMLFPENVGLGATQPTGSAMQSLVFEAVMSWLLMLVILSVSEGAKEKGMMAGVAVGGTIALDALFGGPVSGASMNPARSLGPALISGHANALWVYLVGPIAGVAAAVICHRFLCPKHGAN